MRPVDSKKPVNSPLLLVHKEVVRAESLSLNTDAIDLKNLSFVVHPAQIVAVIGPNGAGKSTLLRAIAGDYDESSPWRKRSGDLQWLGTSLLEKRHSEFRKKVAVMTQHSQLNFPFLVEDVVAMGRMPHSTAGDVNVEIVSGIINALDLHCLKHKLYTSLSGGEKQRVQFARALVQIVSSPLGVLDEIDFTGSLLILDEPFSAQDLKYQALIKKWLLRLKQNGLAVIVVLHDIALAYELTDRSLGLRDGAQAFYGCNEDVLTEKNLSALFDVSVKSVTACDQRLFTVS